MNGEEYSVLKVTYNNLKDSVMNKLVDNDEAQAIIDSL